MKRYSLPTKTEKGKLSTLFWMEARDFPSRPGRVLHVAYDGFNKLVEDFKAEYIYWVDFKQRSSIAGNHYHKKKQELFLPVMGDFSVRLAKPCMGSPLKEGCK